MVSTQVPPLSAIWTKESWTRAEIIDSVANFQGGCAAGKESFLASMGILHEFDPDAPTPEFDSELLVVRSVVLKAAKWNRTYGMSKNAKQILEYLFRRDDDSSYLRVSRLTIIPISGEVE